MKLTAIPVDNLVAINGIGRILNLSNCKVPDNIHALQWKDTSGWIEFVDNPDGTKPQNEPITDLPDWANACVTVWNEWTPDVPSEKLQAEQPNTTGTQTI